MEEEAQATAKLLTKGLRKWYSARRYVFVIEWSSLSGGYVPHPPGLGARQSKYGLIANKLARFGCLERRGGAWHSTALGRAVKTELQKGDNR